MTDWRLAQINSDRDSFFENYNGSGRVMNNSNCSGSVMNVPMDKCSMHSPHEAVWERLLTRMFQQQWLKKEDSFSNNNIQWLKKNNYFSNNNNGSRRAMNTENGSGRMMNAPTINTECMHILCRTMTTPQWQMLNEKSEWSSEGRNIWFKILGQAWSSNWCSSSKSEFKAELHASLINCLQIAQEAILCVMYKCINYF